MNEQLPLKRRRQRVKPNRVQSCTSDLNDDANRRAGLISDLTPGTTVWVRIRKVMGAWSDPTKIKVI